MPENYSFMYHEMTLFPIQDQFNFLASFQTKDKLVKHESKDEPNTKNIIQDFSEFFNNVTENRKYTPLKSS